MAKQVVVEILREKPELDQSACEGVHDLSCEGVHDLCCLEADFADCEDVKFDLRPGSGRGGLSIIPV